MRESEALLNNLIGSHLLSVQLEIFSWAGKVDLRDALPALEFQQGYLRICPSAADDYLLLQLVQSWPENSLLSAEEWLETEEKVGAWQTLQVCTHPLIKLMISTPLSDFSIKRVNDYVVGVTLMFPKAFLHASLEESGVVTEFQPLRRMP